MAKFKLKSRILVSWIRLQLRIRVETNDNASDGICRPLIGFDLQQFRKNRHTFYYKLWKLLLNRALTIRYRFTHTLKYLNSLWDIDAWLYKNRKYTWM